MMKLRAIFIFLSLVTSLLAREWTIHWEAAKGEMSVTLPLKPKPLSDFLTSLPSGHFEANADINNGLVPSQSTVKILGVFQGRKVFSIEQNVKGSYYSRYHLIVVETEPALYFPIYINQYALGHSSHTGPKFSATKKDFSVSVTVTTRGTSSSSVTYKVTSDLKKAPKVERVDVGQTATVLDLKSQGRVKVKSKRSPQ